ncbi:MAG: Gfo/Idh/MocA family oxidoreductase, partial [Bacteroidota bacterium]
MTPKKPNPRRAFIKKVIVAATTFSIVPRHVLGKGYISPNDKINIALIGCGKKSPGIARTYVKNPNAQIIAASDLFPGKIKEFQNHAHTAYAASRGKSDYESVRAYVDYKEMLERKDIDGVVVASPDHWHAVHAIHAMKEGKDVYCEKPLAHSIAEGRAMVKATRKYGRILQTGSQQRSGRNFRHACELVRNGYLGEIKKV